MTIINTNPDIDNTYVTKGIYHEILKAKKQTIIIL